MKAGPVITTAPRVLLTALLWATLFTARGEIPALDPGFSVRSWDTEDGLPGAAINALARTPDGYLWLGTGSGLVRFDGVRFVLLTTNTTPALGHNRITSLLTDGQGVLWIGTQAGTLARREDGRIVRVPLDGRLRGVPINSLKPARAGGLWLATARCGLIRLAEGGCDFSTPTNGLWRMDVSRVVREEANQLWVVSGSRLLMLAQGRWQTVPGGPDATTPTFAVAASAGDAAWIATASENPFRNRGGRVFRFDRGQSFQELAPYPWSQDSLRASIYSVLEDHQGRVWVGTVGDGVFLWIKGTGWRRLDSAVLQNGGSLPVILEDAEGLVWMAGSKGTLYQVREHRVMSLRLQSGEAGMIVNSVCAAREGSIWMGTDDAGVFRFAHDAFNPITDGMTNLHVFSVLADHRTNLWAGTLNGLYRWQQDRFLPFALPLPSIPAVSVLYEDRHSNVWAGTTGGLVKITPEGATTLFAKESGLNNYYFRSLAEDGQGRLCVAVGEFGLYRLAGEHFESFRSDRWAGAGDIRSLLADAEGALWITTSGAGLFRFQDGVFRQWSRQDGLPEMSLNGIIEDDRGNLWCGSENGIFGCPRAAFLANQEGRNWPLLFWHISVEDGMDSKVCSGVTDPVIAGTADGRLWFPNGHALAVFDPAKVAAPGWKLNPFAEEVVADGVICQPEAAGAVRLRSGARRVEFHYTCPELQSPGRLHFQYRLEGSDPDWVDAGLQRVAYYGQLPPGDYRFRVLVGSVDGGWREAAAALPFSILPRWWERTSVRVPGILSIAALLAGSVWMVARTRHRRRLARLQLQHARESERIRIARDLHDDLGASLTHVVLQSEMLAGQTAIVGEAQRRARTIADAAAESVKSLDEIVWAVSPRHDTLDSLLQYLSQFAGELFNDSSLSLTLDLPAEPPPIPLSAETRHNVFLAVKEALNNILKHSQARQGGLRVAVRATELELEVFDDGVGGVDPNRTAGTQRDGLPNMRQRVEALSGSLRIESPPNRGTRITFIVPLPQWAVKP